MAELSLNTQFEGQQTPGVASGLGGTEKKTRERKATASRGLSMAAQTARQQLAGPQRADKNMQRRSSKQLTQHKACARPDGGLGNFQIQGESGHEFPLLREHLQKQS
ncbi:hypothetical protein [Polaromonas sp. P5_D5]